ncbi:MULTISPECIES: trehalose operon repressor [unclassified Exiguobacterium]|uniref:trehalose operon repressor n=2 Tax=Bacillales Family XII. Incertae Sedis TaxID=539742 RepID=UPI0005141A1B|nr:trehalose operon repressor [Exiguobacterium sp. s55]KGI86102.1 GntR family transcriptional regulator [Exiguobacterium mexicanum]
MAKYRQIYERLAERMKTGEYAAESKLPSETELMHEYEASRGTVRKALDLLQEHGYVRKHHGKGVFVLRRDQIEFQFNGIVSFSEVYASLLGRSIQTSVASFEDIEAPTWLADRMNLEPGTRMYRIERVRNFDGEDVILDVNYFVKDLVPGLTEEIAARSIYEYVEHELGLQISYAKRKIAAEDVTELDRMRLDLHDYEYVIVITNDTFLYEGRQFEYTESRHRLDKFQFSDVARR